jgi:PAS domain S-box-containing protein
MRVNLHCHSNLSDGDLSPELLVGHLAASGVRAAALTDHDTVDGIKSFQEAAARKEIGCILGIEMSVAGFDGNELHLLGYGFDPENPALREHLNRVHDDRRGKLRQHLGGTLQDALPRSHSNEKPNSPTVQNGPGLLPISEAITLLHQAGGLAFLAHPLTPEQDYTLENLEPLLERLKQAGLDGIEAIYVEYPARTREGLLQLAERHGLLVSAGSDFHSSSRPGLCDPGIDMPVLWWRRFRDAIFENRYGSKNTAKTGRPAERRKTHIPFWKSFVVRILLPTALVIVLFVFSLYQIIIPAFERNLLDRKREMIRELTTLACGILSEYGRKVQEGQLSLSQAQKAAAQSVQALRYGKEGKDYFWITDGQPRMIVHPYRPDLNGQDVSNFKDQRGRAIFVEFANALLNKEDDYVEYVWQWKDDPERLEPKQSYIKKYTPWGWIVGTGIYVEDVRREIAAMETRMVRISLGITAFSTLLLAFVALQSMRIETRRRQAEEDLHASHEKYRALVEATTDGVLMILDGRFVYANQTIGEMLGYFEGDFPLLELEDLLAEGIDRNMALFSSGNQPLEIALKKKNGDRLPVALTATAISFTGKTGSILTIRDLSGRNQHEPERKSRDFEREKLIAELQTSLMFLHEPVSNCLAHSTACDLRESIAGAVERMTRQNCGSILVTSGDDTVGIVTDYDIRKRVVAGSLPLHHPVMQIMSAPLIGIHHRAPVYEAILLMREKGVRHLVARDESGRVVGVVDSAELLRFHPYSLAVMTQEIQRAGSAEAIVPVRKKMPRLVQSLLEGGAKPRNIMHAITSIADDSTAKLVQFAIARLGEPPARFAFLALGSQGREELTLASDQDNAILYEDPMESMVAASKDYFLQLGTLVCDWLDQAGYPQCTGNVMAKNPKWCQPADVWKKSCTEWINAAEPQNLLEIMTFFDFRVVYGEKDLAFSLRRHIDRELAKEPPFLPQFAHYALQYKIPLGFFGQIVTETTKDHAPTFNIKEAMMPVVNFARLYALRHGVPDTHTLDRIHALRRLDALKPSLHGEAVQIYDCLMRLRLNHHAEAAGRDAIPQNSINPKSLTHMEETLLKEAFAQINNIQKKISYDFFGSV